MKKIFILSLLIPVLLSACQSAKEAFTLQKKPSSDEFLVEKKSPLTLPPEYGKLPTPENIKPNSNEVNESNIDQSLNVDILKSNETIKNSEPTSIENSVLKKIK